MLEQNESVKVYVFGYIDEIFICICMLTLINGNTYKFL